MAVGRILGRGASGERRQLVAGAGQLGQPGLRLGQAAGDQAGDVHARRLAVIADVQDLPDVLQGEPGGLGVPDEREALLNARIRAVRTSAF